MKDYQKIYKELGEELLYKDANITRWIYQLKSFGDLQELVDKATPMEVKELRDDYVKGAFKNITIKNAQGKCECGQYPFRGQSYCSHCGQALKWH